MHNCTSMSYNVSYLIYGVEAMYVSDLGAAILYSASTET